MLPTLDYIPADEVLYLKREELMREFQEIRLINAANEARPGLVARLQVRIASLFHSRARVRAPRQTYIDSAIRLAA